jgi:hypothetical protein
MYSFERSAPVGVVDDRLRGVSGERHNVNAQLGRHRRRVPVDPTHAIGPRLSPRDIEHCARRIDSGDIASGAGEHDGERAGAATEVEDAGRAQLRDDRQVEVEVAAVRVEQVVDAGDPRIVKLIRTHPKSDDNTGKRAVPRRQGQSRTLAQPSVARHRPDSVER